MTLSNAKRFATNPIVLYSALVAITVLTYIRGINNLFVAEDFHNLNDFSIPFSDFLHYLAYSSRVKLVGFGFEWVITQLFGLQPVGYHLVLIALHLAVVLVLVQLAAKLFNNIILAVLVGAIFAVYPRNHQDILWYGAINISMVILFMVITIFAFYCYLETSRLRWQIIALTAFFAALLTHESSIFLIPILFFLEILFFSRQEGLRKILKPMFWFKYAPYIGLFIVYFLINFTGLRSFRLTGGTAPTELISVGGTGEGYQLTPLGASTIRSMLGYLTYATFPHIPLRGLDKGVVSYFIAGLTLLLLAAVIIKGDRVVRFGAAWIIISALPFVLFVPFGNADRYFYMLGVGFAIMLSGVLNMLYRKYGASNVVMPLVVFLVGLYLLSSVFLIQTRIGEWKQAGLIADNYITQVVNLVPNPAPGSQFLFVNPPASYEQAYIFLGGGMSGALPLRFNKGIPDLHVFHSFDPDVIQKVETAPPSATRLPNLYILLYENGQVIDKSSVSLDVAALNPANWNKG